MDKEKKNKKLPFNTFRKGIVAGILGLTLGVSAFGLAGCSDGADGKNGTQWLSGTSAPVVSQGVDGDFYFDTDDYVIYQKVDGQWISLGNIKGQSGTSVYVGYDGHIWQGQERTDFKVEEDKVGREDVVEDTMSVYGEMRSYFAGNYVNLSSSRIALMANYKSNAKLTQYGNTTVTEIKVISNASGKLEIGTAKVEDIVANKTSGTSYTANTTSYDVVAGENTIALNLEVAEDSTIVLGGGETDVSLYQVSNLPVNDEMGNYTLLDGTTNASILSTTGSLADTLAVRVKAETESEVALFENILTQYPASSIASMDAVNQATQPYCYKNYDYMKGRTITKIGVPVKSITATSGEKPSMTVYKVKTSSSSLLSGATPITIYFSEDTTINTWAYAECNIELADDETLAFGSLTTDTLLWGYSKTTSQTEYHFYNNSKQNCALSLVFDVYYKDTASWDNHIEALEEKEQEAINESQVQALRRCL